MNIHIFENRQRALNLDPITLTRPAFEVRCGAFTFFERVKHLFPDEQLVFFVREEIKGVVEERYPGIRVNPAEVKSGIWLDGSTYWNREMIMSIMDSSGHLFISNGTVVGAHLDAKMGSEWLEQGGPVLVNPDLPLPEKEISVQTPEYLWECVHLNEKVLEEDSLLFDLGMCFGNVDDGVHVVNEKNTYIGKRSKIKAGTVLDSENGPIIVGDNVTILSNSYLQGPLYIGDGCVIKAGARIYGGTAIGPGCKIGGEVEASIFQGWSNKQHDGFIGHAYIGEWVNLGADTNNSDLKNNYSNISVFVNGKNVDTGSKFVGLFMGDHSKTGINTMFNTGTSVGPACNIVGYGFPPKNIPPFAWVVNRKIRRHLFNKFVETARIVKERREQVFSLSEELLYRQILEKS